MKAFLVSFALLWGASSAANFYFGNCINEYDGPHKEDLGHGAKVKGFCTDGRKTKRFVYYVQDSTEVIRIRFNKDEIKGIACRITNEGRGNWKDFKTIGECLAAQRQNNIPTIQGNK